MSENKDTSVSKIIDDLADKFLGETTTKPVSENWSPPLRKKAEAFTPKERVAVAARDVGYTGEPYSAAQLDTIEKIKAGTVSVQFWPKRPKPDSWKYDGYGRHPISADQVNWERVSASKPAKNTAWWDWLPAVGVPYCIYSNYDTEVFFRLSEIFNSYCRNGADHDAKLYTA